MLGYLAAVPLRGTRSSAMSARMRSRNIRLNHEAPGRADLQIRVTPGHLSDCHHDEGFSPRRDPLFLLTVLRSATLGYAFEVRVGCFCCGEKQIPRRPEGLLVMTISYFEQCCYTARGVAATLRSACLRGES